MLKSIVSLFNRLINNPPYNPDLIDLKEYEKALKKSVENKIPLLPPPPIPAGSGSPWRGGWTIEELRAMLDNRSEARELFVKYFESKREGKRTNKLIGL